MRWREQAAEVGQGDPGARRCPASVGKDGGPVTARVAEGRDDEGRLAEILVLGEVVDGDHAGDPGAGRGQQAVARVLDDGGAIRGQAERFQRQQVDIRRRLLAGDDISGKHAHVLGALGPTARSRVARTEDSADVEATATAHPPARASSTTRATPGRGGTAPEATSSRYSSVLRRCQAAIAACWPAASAGSPARATNDGVSRLAMRSLPPPMRSFSW